MDVLDAVHALEDEHLRGKIHKAIFRAQRTLDLYGLSGVSFSFNGGKDSTVLLHILRAAVCKYIQEQGADAACNGFKKGLGGMHTFVFHRDDDFPEIRQFLEQAEQDYEMHIEVLQGDFKAGLEALLAGWKFQAIFLGTRRGDPNAEGQEIFCPSSAGWPPFMRVNPILDWTYADVWAFLRAIRVPYCSLYDRGYTSVGGVRNTAPNAALRKEDGTFAPPDMLPDSRLERAGRSRQVDRRPSDVASRTRKAGLIIVGDEILAAKVNDVNTEFLCAQLRSIGWRVSKVVVVPDEVPAISAEVLAMSDAYELVITSGGLGPTLDDVTMAGIADAFSVPLSRDPNLEARLRRYFGEHITKAHLKLAEVPEGECELVEEVGDGAPPSPFPLLRCRNVYVMPGIPSLLRHKCKCLQEHLARAGDVMSPFRSVALRLSLSDETIIAPALDRINEEMQGQVAVGSYPVTAQADGAGIVLSLESKDTAALEAARSLLLSGLPEGVVVSEERDTSRYSRQRASRRSSLEARPDV